MSSYSENIVSMATFLSRLNKYEIDRLRTNNSAYNIQDLDKVATIDDLLDMVNDADVRSLAYQAVGIDRIVFFMSSRMKDAILCTNRSKLMIYNESQDSYFAGRECIIIQNTDYLIIGFAILIGDHVHHMTKVKFID